MRTVLIIAAIVAVAAVAWSIDIEIRYETPAYAEADTEHIALMAHLRKSAVTGHLLKRTTDGHLAKCWRCTECSNSIEVVLSGIDANACGCTADGSKSVRVNSLAIDGTYDLTKTATCTWTATGCGAYEIEDFAVSGSCTGASTTYSGSFTITLRYASGQWLLNVSDIYAGAVRLAVFGAVNPSDVCPNGMPFADTNSCVYSTSSLVFVGSHGGNATATEN